MAKELKEIVVANFQDRMSGMTDCVLIDYHGLDAERTVDLRNTLRQEGVRMTVVHNRLIRRAFKSRDDLPAKFSELFRGPTAILDAEEALSTIKSIAKWRKKNENLAEIKGGLFEGQVLTPGELSELAKIPDKETLQAQSAGMFLGPLQFLASSIRDLLSHFASCVKAHKDELES
jgi:large subunit ribosomal protein L10